MQVVPTILASSVPGQAGDANASDATMDSKTQSVKVREVIRILEGNGFRQVRQSGSHRRFEGIVGGRTRRVTVAGHSSDDFSMRTLASIRRQSGLPRKLFRSV